ncbi:MAG: DUF2147 domain-containing protein [Amylibacter sp.]|nr:DUF2147 domain-containing protein [Amylibacter sp.]
MKKLAIIAAAVLISTPVLAAEAVFGTWKTSKDDNGNYGHIEVAQCGTKICGKLVKSFNSDGSKGTQDNIGKNIVWDMTNEGDGAYGGGKIWSPDRDKTYKSKMQLNGDTLAVQGCILFICRDGGTWTRVN